MGGGGKGESQLYMRVACGRSWEGPSSELSAVGSDAPHLLASCMMLAIDLLAL